MKGAAHCSPVQRPDPECAFANMGSLGAAQVARNPATLPVNRHGPRGPASRAGDNLRLTGVSAAPSFNAFGLDAEIEARNLRSTEPLQRSLSHALEKYDV